MLQLIQFQLYNPKSTVHKDKFNYNLPHDTRALASQYHDHSDTACMQTTGNMTYIQTSMTDPVCELQNESLVEQDHWARNKKKLTYVIPACSPTYM